MWHIDGLTLRWFSAESALLSRGIVPGLNTGALQTCSRACLGKRLGQMNLCPDVAHLGDSWSCLLFTDSHENIWWGLGRGRERHKLTSWFTGSLSSRIEKFIPNMVARWMETRPISQMEFLLTTGIYQLKISNPDKYRTVWLFRLLNSIELSCWK